MESIYARTGFENRQGFWRCVKAAKRTRSCMIQTVLCSVISQNFRGVLAKAGFCRMGPAGPREVSINIPL